MDSVKLFHIMEGLINKESNSRATEQLRGRLETQVLTLVASLKCFHVETVGDAECWAHSMTSFVGICWNET